MNKIGNLLWKIFSATMVFFYNTNDSFAATVTEIRRPIDLGKLEDSLSGWSGNSDNNNNNNNTNNSSSSESGSNSATYNTDINTIGQGVLYFAKEDGTHITNIDNQNSTDIRIVDETDTPLTDKNGYERDPVKENKNYNGYAFKEQRICNSGQYLYSCNGKVIGTNWLKGISTANTPDYFSYGDNYKNLNMTNLRKFFNGIDTITYMESTNCGENYTNCEYTPKDIQKSTYVKYRNEILTKFCTDGDGKLFSDKSLYVCNKCDNNATISASTVRNDTYATGKIFGETWNIHTIADCYMSEFSDTSGTFIYVPESNFEQQNTGMPCYYSTYTSGSKLD